MPVVEGVRFLWKVQEFVMDCDTIVVAIGQGSNPVLVSRMPGLELTKRGNICV